MRWEFLSGGTAFPVPVTVAMIGIFRLRYLTYFQAIFALLEIFQT